MRDLLSGFGRKSIDGGEHRKPPIPQPFPIDPWVASSLLQKAIRRSDANLAERAAITLYRQRGNGIWRRFQVIAFEDIGAASVEAIVQTTTACTDHAWRKGVG